MSKNFFKKRPYKRVEVGPWVFEWFADEKHPEKGFMRVMGESGLFDLRITANSYVFGYLLAAAEQGLVEQLHGWITLVYVPIMAMTQDQGLTDDISKAISKWMRRKDAEAKSEAKSVTPEQEQADEAFMGDIVSEVDMDEKELAEKRKADREILKDILNNNDLKL